MSGGSRSYGPVWRTEYPSSASPRPMVSCCARSTSNAVPPPASLPVEQMDVLELVVNVRTAQALGLTIPWTALVQATAVIQ